MDDNLPGRPMLTVAEVARLLNVHVNTVRRWSDTDILKCYRVASRGDRRFRQEDIKNFLNHVTPGTGSARHL
jgi:excisionase family DNA binding protein